MILVFILPIVKAVQLIDQKGDIMLNLQRLEQHIQIEQKTNDELEKALDDENVHFIVTDYPIKKSIFFPWSNFTYPFP